MFQTGSMQRSTKEFRVACELVRNGAIGKVAAGPVQLRRPGRALRPAGGADGAGLDWDLWLGPAPMRAYNSVLSPRGVHEHFPDWRNYREFGGGMVTDWGAHHLDIAQWGLGMDDSGPVEVRPPETAGDKRGATLVYANGVTVTHEDGFGVDFFGSEGRVQVNRGRFTFTREGRADRLVHQARGRHLLRGPGGESGEGVPEERRRSGSTPARTTSPTSWAASGTARSPSRTSRSAAARPSAAT